MSYADEIKKMTSDPGARRLGAIADDLEAKLTVLQTKVAACCDGPDFKPDQPPDTDAPAAKPAARHGRARPNKPNPA